jgi:hypothetical protein
MPWSDSTSEPAQSEGGAEHCRLSARRGRERDSTGGPQSLVVPAGVLTSNLQISDSTSGSIFGPPRIRPVSELELPRNQLPPPAENRARRGDLRDSYQTLRPLHKIISCSCRQSVANFVHENDHACRFSARQQSQGEAMCRPDVTESKLRQCASQDTSVSRRTISNRKAQAEPERTQNR